MFAEGDEEGEKERKRGRMGSKGCTEVSRTIRKEELAEDSNSRDRDEVK